jgi:molecular chaperone DnaJ
VDKSYFELLIGMASRLLLFLSAVLLCSGCKAESTDQADNFYDFLGVSSSATLDEIKRSYRRLAIELHPDKLSHTAADTEKEACKEKFLLLQKAYETLSDDKERMLYDYDLIYGNQHGKDATPPTPPPPDEPYSGSRYSTLIKASGVKVAFNVQFPATAIPDMEIPVNVSLKHVIEGGQQNVSYIRRNVCLVCQGLGVALEDRVVCELCQGKGNVWQKLKVKGDAQRSGSSFEQLSYCQCPGCLGRGFKVSASTRRCVACGGYGYIYEDAWFTAYFQKGMEDGQVYLYESIGNQHRDGRRGHVQVTGHYDVPIGFIYDRNTSDLIYTHNTTLSELEKGLSFGFSYPTGDWMDVDIPEDISVQDIITGFEVRLEGLGLFKETDTEIEKGGHYDKNGVEDDIVVDLDGFFDDETIQKGEDKLRGDLVVKIGLNWTDISPSYMFETLVVSS